MSGCPFHSSAPSTATQAAVHSIEEELAFLSEAHPAGSVPERLSAFGSALAAGRPAPLTKDELTWAGRIAWRNHSRCIGRLYWKSLLVRDHRHLETADALAESLREHLILAQGEGMIRSILTVFAPPERVGGPAPRIWNHQLCAYAGYRQGDGLILGDSKNAVLTELALGLGWQPPVKRSRFDLLPWIISGRDGEPKLFPLPAGFVREVPLRHPRLPWFEELELRWYAVPVISDMILHAAGTDFPAAPFNGWFMSTEIGARDLADEARYHQLPVIAQKLGLDLSHPRTLWKDRALIELNAAVLHSFECEGVKLVDHHTASAEFVKFCEREQRVGRAVSARWDWIVPPLSPATTEVFHTPMQEFATTPNFLTRPESVPARGGSGRGAKLSF